MSINKGEKFLELFHQLPESDQNSILDFMEYLAARKKRNELERFYANLPEVDEPLSKEEIRQINKTEFVSWEDACRELGWNDGDQTEPEGN